jgi:hypothetical protein
MSSLTGEGLVQIRYCDRNGNFGAECLEKSIEFG